MKALIRLVLDDRPGALAQAAAAIAQAGADIVAVDVVERDGSQVVDDFIVELKDHAGISLEPLANRLRREPGIVIDCLRPTPQAELHRELELLTRLAVDQKPSLDLLVRLIPAIVRCDWAVMISSAGIGVGVTHASIAGPRIRWTSLPWLPLSEAAAIDPDGQWVPWRWYSDGVAFGAAPIDSKTTILACRSDGPSFLKQEISHLGQLATLAGQLLTNNARAIRAS